VVAFVGLKLPCKSRQSLKSEDYFISKDYPRCNHFIYDYVHATISHLQLPLDTFVTISCVGHIYDYTSTSLQLLWFSSFHVKQHLV